MTDDELKALVASLAIGQKELQAAQKVTDEQMRKTDEQVRKTELYIKELGRLVGNISNNQGFVAEDFFYNSLRDNPHLGSVYFDDITKNETKCKNKTEEEFDILMTNGESVGIVEVKYKAHENDLKQLERKMRNFNILYPMYANYKIYGAIASFHIYEAARQKALQRGFFVLQRRGKIIHTELAEELMVL